MGRDRRTPPLLDADHAAFIRGGVSIMAASSGPGNVPSLERAIGCKVPHDRQRITIFVAAVPARALLEDVRRSRRIAVVFSEPATHRTIQIKGSDAAMVPVGPADRAIVAAYADRMVEVFGRTGRPEPLVRALLACPAEDLFAIAFAPEAAFVQTPGPRAGTPLKG